MALQFIDETDPMDVSSLCVLLYGQPGCWKTSLAQTAEEPITLDFDKGLHRVFNRKAGFRFDRWADVGLAEVVAQIARRKTVIVDTIGRALDLLTLEMLGGNPAKILTIQQWGQLKGRFAQWVSALRTAGKDVIFIAHEKEEKQGEEWYSRPDVQGGSYGEIMKFTDIVGYLTIGPNGERVLDCNPTREHMGKNAAGWEPLTVPSLKEQPKFLAGLLADAKKQIGNVAQLSAQIAAAVGEWSEWLEGDPNLDDFNAALPDLSEMPQAAKSQVWHLLQSHAVAVHWTFDAKAKRFAKPAPQSNGTPVEAK